MKSLLALLLLTSAASAQTLPGFDHLAVDAPHRPRPLQASVWYPAGSKTYTVPLGANPAFLGTMVQMGPAIASGAHPLVVISHGSGGNIDNLGWLAEGLALRGAIVAGVNHPGATSGDSSPRQLPMVIDRTQDLGALIETLTTNPAFGPAIDPAQITALGFSLGGATVLAAGGARLSAPAFASYCETYGADASECAFMARGGLTPTDLPKSFTADMTISGLAHIIAVDPALGHVFIDETLTRLPKVHLIKMGDGDLVPPARDIGADGSNLPGRIAGATYTNITPGWHFSFLGLCTPDAPAMLAADGEDPICDDPEGADRAVIHARIIDDIATTLGL